VLPQSLEFAVVHLNDIEVSEDATFKIYSDFGYINKVDNVSRLDENMQWIPVHLYILVTSANQENFRYYIITIELEDSNVIDPVASLQVECMPGDRKIALLWRVLEGEDNVASYQLRVDDSPWITPISLCEVLNDSNTGMNYYLFEGLTNGVEYTLQIRAINKDGLPGNIYEVKGIPEPPGEIGGVKADLISLFSQTVIPHDGWPPLDGLAITSPREATIVLPQSLEFAMVHRNYINVSEDATFAMYLDSGFTNETNIVSRLDENMQWISVNLYIAVKSGNQDNTMYYVITVE
jgi:hypothetical protein